jgi:hypothetical protein
MIKQGQHYHLEYDVDEAERTRMKIGIMTRDKKTQELKKGGIFDYKLPIFDSKARFIFAIGGKGGGKTIVDPIWVYNEMLVHPGGKALIVGPDWPRMRLQLLPYFIEFFDMSPLAGKYDALEHIYHLGKNWGELYFLAADTPADARKLESIHAVCGVGDEAGQWDDPVWDAFRGRINSQAGRAIISSTAYLTRGTWLRDIYEAATVHRWEEENDNYRLLHEGRQQKSGNPFYEMFLFKSEDNPHFDKEVLEEERKLLTKRAYMTYYEGDIPQILGAIFPEFGDSHIIKADKEAEILNRINSSQAKQWIRQVGHDLGYGHPSVSTFMVYDPERDKLIITDEVYLERDDTKDHVASIVEVNKKYAFPFINVQYPLEGAEQAGLANELARAKGWNLYFQRAQDDPEKEKMFRSVDAGLDVMGGFIGHARFEVLESRCPRLIEEIKKYRRESFETKYEEGAKIVKKKNDGVDATRYGIIAIRNRIKAARQEWEKRAAERKYPVGQYSPADPVEHRKTTGKISVGGKRFKVRVRV